MAHKKGLGSSKNGRDSNPKYLGVKLFAGQDVEAGHDHRPPARHELPARPRDADRARRHDLRRSREGTVAFRTSGERRFVSVDAAS